LEVITAEQIKEQAEKIFATVVEARRHIHQHPELSFRETETSKYICSVLDKMNIPYTTGHVKTGIVALIKGKDPEKKVVLLRADMDALPIVEQNETDYVSKNKGVMHACGHDVHSASVIGAAYILNHFKNEFEGTVKLIFQPGEEVLPGGASLMIQEGILKDPTVNTAIAQHVHPSMEVGKVGFKSGMYMASTDEIYLTITGKGGHAAMPADYNSPLLIASEVLLELKKKFPNDGKSQIPTVLAFGKIEGAGATNVIPEKVDLQGTFRTMDEKWRAEAHDIVTRTVLEVCNKNNAKADLKIMRGYPFLVNDKNVTENCRNAAITYLGKDNVEELPMRMTAEDFAYFSQELPVCFYRLGTGNKSKGITSGVHTPTFDIDENALKIGSGLMAWLAINELKRI
jgi:amidohydrolase